MGEGKKGQAGFFRKLLKIRKKAGFSVEAFQLLAFLWHVPRDSPSSRFHSGMEAGSLGKKGCHWAEVERETSKGLDIWRRAGVSEGPLCCCRPGGGQEASGASGYQCDASYILADSVLPQLCSFGDKHSPSYLVGVLCRA